MPMDDITLADNTSAHRFELRLGDAVAAFAEYQLAPGTLTLTHTEVLPAHEGKGLASKLAKFSLGQVRDRGLKAVPVCSFFAGYIDKHPEYQDLLQA
ncbi:MAG: N-acetyltransferase [Comamonadaceae bacterium]|nr:MAG: N-acetyltransferase [Comamonadaceae bacterium]